MNAPDPRGKSEVEVAPRKRTCVIFAKPAGATGYGWGWQSGERKSKGLFRYFYECVQDARKHGYAVEFSEVAASLRLEHGGASSAS